MEWISPPGPADSFQRRTTEEDVARTVEAFESTFDMLAEEGACDHGCLR